MIREGRNIRAEGTAQRHKLRKKNRMKKERVRRGEGEGRR